MYMIGGSMTGNEKKGICRHCGEKVYVSINNWKHVHGFYGCSLKGYTVADPISEILPVWDTVEI